MVFFNANINDIELPDHKPNHGTKDNSEMYPSK